MNPSTNLPAPLVSVVLCAHDPRRHHLQATLEGLRAQDLPRDRWELLLVDNRSAVPLASYVDLSWHPGARLLMEPELGLARARCCGYREARGGLIVHSDDDNVLAADYLRIALEIRQAHPEIGTFAGQVIPQFAVAPRNPLEQEAGSERRLERDLWSNILDDNRTMPFGAGMCLRQEVVRAYLDQVDRDPRRLVLGRAGNRFLTGEDIDLNFVAVRAGYGTGLFRALSLVHFIPPERMNPEHVIRYRAGNAYSMVILHFLHFGQIKIERRSRAGATFFWLRVWTRMTPFERRREIAMHRARREAVRDLRAWGWLQSPIP
jgi:glycosyltransferase involved in cell wall biosynthesis